MTYLGIEYFFKAVVINSVESPEIYIFQLLYDFTRNSEWCGSMESEDIYSGRFGKERTRFEWKFLGTHAQITFECESCKQTPMGIKAE